VALQKKFNLPANLDVPVERLTTIRGIAEVISLVVGNGNGLAAQPAVAQTVGVQAPIPPKTDHTAPISVDGGSTANKLNPEDIESIVQQVVVEATRYPAEILEPTAHLEDDLGIDSVKRAEILVALQKKFNLPANLDVPVERLTTIRGIAEVISLVVQSNVVDGKLEVQEAALKREPSVGSPVNTRSSVLITDKSSRSQLHADKGVLIATGHKPFKGKVALVTGSGHGIGKTIACRLANLGATVVVNSFHSRIKGEETTEEIRKAGSDAIHLWGSVANPTQLQNIFNEIDSRIGQLDFFVSNASNGIVGPLKDVTEEHWNRAFQTNVIGLHQGALWASAMMKRNGGGKIVSLSSPGSHRYIEYFGCMGPIKAAVESLTLYLAVEFGNDNIQVNCVSAGPIYGDLLSKYPDSNRLIPYWESLSAGNRLGEESDVANSVIYLLSEAANKITGSVLLVDSGGSKRI
jgi:NAD(P)-dependent dehydrogenase (short-subunit alcohol dehydrogenase family)/acyl carrier protein